MSIGLSQAIGIHEDALLLRTQRTAILANNIANASTPGYKARDIDFAAALQQASQKNTASNGLRKTHARHLGGIESHGLAEVMYRQAMQASLDGNTVDEQTENAAFARHMVEYQASFQFLNGKFTGLRKALKGE